MAISIRLTTVILSSDNCQTKKRQLSDEKTTIVRRKFNSCQTINYLHKPT